MDNVTHAALGLAIAQAASPSLGSAGLALALVASELPDADIFLGMGDPWSMVTTHRGITHSVFLIPVAAAVLAGVWSRLSTAGSFWSFLGLGLACLFGHVFLDVLTTYGTQLLEPFSRHRFGWGWVAVIDPAVTASLIAGAVTAWWIRGPHPAAARQVAIAGLVAAACYLLLGGIQHARAMYVLRRRTAALGPAIAEDASPQLGTIFLHRLLYRNNNKFWVARYNSLTGDLSDERVLASWIDPALGPLLETPQARVFRDFAGGLIRPHIDPADANALLLEDMRFSWPTGSPTGLWALRIEFSRNGDRPPQVSRMQFVQRRLRPGSPGPVGERASPVPAADE